mmetsp:Transcript_7106/g.14616  ORF Transcript_7106/g.14616 Transcript_7106/m.14616 type:complete len:131 (-) Transcript_7106:2480-2872(-)
MHHTCKVQAVSPEEVEPFLPPADVICFLAGADCTVAPRTIDDDVSSFLTAAVGLITGTGEASKTDLGLFAHTETGIDGATIEELSRSLSFASASGDSVTRDTVSFTTTCLGESVTLVLGREELVGPSGGG